MPRHSSLNEVKLLWIPGHIRIEGNDVTVVLANKRAGTSLQELEPFCGIENESLAIALKNEEERLRELYLANLPIMEQPRVIMGGYEPKRSKNCSNFSNKSLQIKVGP